MTDTQFGNIVRRAMDVRGWSLRELARQVHYDAGYLSRVISGKKRPSADLSQRLDEALGTEGALNQLGTAVAPDREPILHTRSTPSRIDSETVDSFATVLAAQRRLDDALGSAAVLAPTVAQLGTVEPLAHESEVLRGVAAEWVRFAGWLHASLRNDREAVRLFVRAEELADEAQDPVTAALAVSFRGYVARQRGNWPGVVRAAIAARETPGAHYTQRTFDALQAAQGYAGLAKSLGESDGNGERAQRENARRMLGEASAMIDNMAGDDAEPPPSVYWYTPTFFRMNIGLAHFTLGDMAAAADYLSAGLTGLPDDHRDTEWAQEYWEALGQARAFS